MSQNSERLAAYIAAERAILDNGQRISVNGRSYDRANLSDLQSEIRKLSASENIVTRGPIRAGLRRPSG